jgi:hypothetical protein
MDSSLALNITVTHLIGLTATITFGKTYFLIIRPNKK